MTENPHDPIAHPYPPGTRTVVRDVVGCARCGKHHTMEFRPLAGETGAYRWWALCPETGEPVLMAPSEANGRCETCRWWFGLQALDEAKPPEEGYCNLPGEGKRAKMRPDSPAGIFTKPDFGCVQWEGKGDE